jgi:hypothetical protein
MSGYDIGRKGLTPYITLGTIAQRLQKRCCNLCARHMISLRVCYLHLFRQ